MFLKEKGGPGLRVDAGTVVVADGPVYLVHGDGCGEQGPRSCPGPDIGLWSQGKSKGKVGSLPWFMCWSDLQSRYKTNPV